MAERVRELGLVKGQGPLFYLKGKTVWGRKPRGKAHKVVELAGFFRSAGYLYYIKDGDLWRAKVKR